MKKLHPSEYKTPMLQDGAGLELFTVRVLLVDGLQREGLLRAELELSEAGCRVGLGEVSPRE